MWGKPLIIIIIVTCIAIAAIFFAFDFTNEATTPIPMQESQVTLNQIITEAVTLYATAPYRIYTSEELRKYFICEIADEILQYYEPISDPYEEMQIMFEEQQLPNIGPAWVTLEGGFYAVKLRFGEVFYNYRLKISPNRIITQITEGGITFE